ncbi:aminotransferase class I/II-fold pyridoxal phosphate-dependent enzyme, partial [Flavobacteriaceae bacterium]|nr:aminotransferase class I/II-fold pyridoxal phosphate-dependent enzyme [Flavobacteriaceae bacterium]
MYESIKKRLTKELEEVKISGRYKKERVISSNQSSEINVNNNKVLNFCANNYLGLASDPDIIKRAKDTLDSHGFGMASVRFICGTQDIHKDLESKISN